MGCKDGVGEGSESGIERHPSDEGRSKDNVGRKIRLVAIVGGLRSIQFAITKDIIKDVHVVVRANNYWAV